MLRIGSQFVRTCSGVSRREVLRVGGLGLSGALGAISLPNALASPIPPDVNVLLLFLRGGVSHLDTWDMKPEAPIADARGEFKPIATNVPGI